MDEQERIDKLKNEPLIPGVQWVIGLIILLGIQILVWSLSNFTLMLEISLFVLSVLFTYAIWLLLRCNSNKDLLYTEYKNLHINNQELNKRLQSQIAISKRQDEQLATKREDVIKFLFQEYVLSPLNKQRKED